MTTMKKYIFHIGMAVIALLGTISCQMQEEIWGSKPVSEQMGVLQLKVEATAPNSLTTKADNTVDTDDFAVSVKGKEGTDVKDVVRFFERYAEMPDTIHLPIGDYVVTAHTPGELQKTLSYPYYMGEQALTILASTDKATTVQCKMKNSRIQLNYSDDFTSKFSEWSITITDKSNQALNYTQNDMNPAAIYWYFDEETPEVKVHITAKTISGNTVTSEQTFSKSDASTSYDDVEDTENLDIDSTNLY